MNTHGQHAMETMRNHDPETFSQIQNPEVYFSTLGEQMQEQMEELMTQLLPPRSPGQSTMEVVGGINVARSRAREMVYQEMIYSSLPPEPEVMENNPLPDEDED